MLRIFEVQDFEFQDFDVQTHRCPGSFLLRATEARIHRVSASPQQGGLSHGPWDSRSGWMVT